MAWRQACTASKMITCLCGEDLIVPKNSEHYKDNKVKAKLDNRKSINHFVEKKS